MTLENFVVSHGKQLGNFYLARVAHSATRLISGGALTNSIRLGPYKQCKKELGQYPVILTEHASLGNNPITHIFVLKYFFWAEMISFLINNLLNYYLTIR